MNTDADRSDQMGQATREKLKQFAARILRLEGEKSELTADIREVYAEVKSFGFDTSVLRTAISKLKQDAAERAEQEALEEMYLETLTGENAEEDIPLTATKAAKKARRKSQARLKKDAAREARLADERAARLKVGAAVDDVARKAGAKVTEP